MEAEKSVVITGESRDSVHFIVKHRRFGGWFGVSDSVCGCAGDSAGFSWI